MNTKKATKRALLTSVTALVMCVVMLVGTTFAWFTDTASTAVNKIQAGNLNVALEMKVTENNETKWVSAEGKTLNWVKAVGHESEQVLWEPGATYALPELRIVNKGNLALKYKISISGAKDATPENDKNDLKLLDVIDWTYSVKGAGGNDVAELGTERHLAAKTTDTDVFDTLTIKGQMQKSAGNDYQGMAIEGIAITVYATQDTVEYDSFGNTYDENAPFIYPAGVTEDSFENATSVLYSKTWGGFSIGTATTTEELQAHPAVVAYLKNGVMTYAADLRVAMADGATVIYCKEDAVVSTVGSHINVVSDLTIYANGADFKGGDLSIHAGGGNYAVPANNENTINIYSAKNLSVWGEPQAAGRVWNVNFYDCANDGSNFFMYRGDKSKTDTFHLTMTNCTANGYSDSIVHATADGSIVIKNCTFTNNCAPINIAHKQSETLTVTVEDSTFVNCGKVNPENDYFAPARFVNNSRVGTLNVTLKNNTFTGTVGTNGDILLGDYREAGKSFAFTTNIVTEHSVMVKSSAEAAYSCDGGDITTVNY